MFIDIKDIAAEGKKVSGSINLGTLLWQDHENIEVPDAIFEAFFQWSEKGFHLKGKAHLLVAMNCSRCLERFSTSIDTEFNLNLKEEIKDTKADNRPVEEEEIDVFPIKGSIIDMREVLSEQIYLNLPLKPLCKQDCQGLCAVCGANLNYNNCTCSGKK